jgi:hypothetical protein
VLDAGVPLERRNASWRERQSEERQEGDDERKSEAAKQHAMQERRQETPQLQQRHPEERRDHEERPQQGLPDALAEEGKPTEAYPALEALGQRVILSRFGRGLL